MHILFSPTRCDTALTLERQGDRLTLNGARLDLSAIPEGATLPRAAIDCSWIAGDITRTDGVLLVPLRLPHGARASAATLLPAPMTLSADGPVDLPSFEEPAHA